MCKDTQRQKDTLAVLFANGQISFDSFRDAVNHIDQREYDRTHIKVDGREG